MLTGVKRSTGPSPHLYGRFVQQSRNFVFLGTTLQYDREAFFFNHLLLEDSERHSAGQKVNTEAILLTSLVAQGKICYFPCFSEADD